MTSNLDRCLRCDQRMADPARVSCPDCRPAQADPINPSHYQSPSGMQAIDVVEAFGLGFNLGNAVKYILRAGRKTPNPTTDLKKAIWNLERYLKGYSAIAGDTSAPPKRGLSAEDAWEEMLQGNCVRAIGESTIAWRMSAGLAYSEVYPIFGYGKDRAYWMKWSEPHRFEIVSCDCFKNYALPESPKEP